MLNYDSLTKALASLERAYQAKCQSPDNEFLLDACIQRFEYSYELSHKMLKRFLEQTEPTKGIVDAMSFPELIRTGYERGLLQSSWDKWQLYRQARNLTSHTYNEKKANQVFAVIPQFVSDANALLTKLNESNHDGL